METSIEFFLYLVAMARLLVVFLRNHRKSRKKRQAKACDRSEQPVVYRTLAKTSEELLSRIHSILLQMVYSWRRSTVTDGVCKDNTSNDPFSRCKSVQHCGYRWNWRSLNTVWLQMHNWTTKSRRKELYTWYCVCVVKQSDKTHDTNDNVTIKGIASAWQNRARHQWQSDTQRTWTSTREFMHAWSHVRIIQ